jgi:hypothetical protein
MNPINLNFQQIFKRLEDREYMIVHMKETMIPKILDVESMILYDIPEGYLDYDKANFYRRVI